MKFPSIYFCAILSDFSILPQNQIANLALFHMHYVHVQLNSITFLMHYAKLRIIIINNGKPKMGFVFTYKQNYVNTLFLIDSDCKYWIQTHKNIYTFSSINHIPNTFCKFEDNPLPKWKSQNGFCFYHKIQNENYF